MVSSFLVSAGDEGAKREEIFDYVKSVMPSDKSEGQNRRALGNILVEMKALGKIRVLGKKWYHIE
jgi:ATP-dependent DNA helicase RecG